MTMRMTLSRVKLWSTWMGLKWGMKSWRSVNQMHGMMMRRSWQVGKLIEDIKDQSQHKEEHLGRCVSNSARRDNCLYKEYVIGWEGIEEGFSKKIIDGLELGWELISHSGDLRYFFWYSILVVIFCLVLICRTWDSHMICLWVVKLELVILYFYRLFLSGLLPCWKKWILTLVDLSSRDLLVFWISNKDLDPLHMLITRVS